MNAEKQKIAIAEACGIFGDCPDYLNNLNAMEEAEYALSPEQYKLYVKNIAKALPPYTSDTAAFAYNAVLYSTAAERAKAFLRTLGKWEDDK